MTQPHSTRGRGRRKPAATARGETAQAAPAEQGLKSVEKEARQWCEAVRRYKHLCASVDRLRAWVARVTCAPAPGLPAHMTLDAAAEQAGRGRPRFAAAG